MPHSVSPKIATSSLNGLHVFQQQAVLLSNFGTCYTNYGFNTYREIKVPSDALTQGLNN